VVLPGVLRHERALKQAKLLQFAARVWDLDAGSADGRVEQAIAKTEQFFQAMGVATTLDAYGVGAEACGHVADRFAARNVRIGEQKQIGPDEVREIMSSRLTARKR
jgi:NADP-dependent alcohol dehydrogenase